MKSFGKIKSCVVCKKKNFQKWAQLEEYVARKCKNCGMISVNPTPDQEFLDRYYEGYLEENKKDLKLWNQRKITYEIDKKWISKFIDKGKVLDVGCSGGQFLSYFDSRRWRKYGVEVDRKAALEAKIRHKIVVKSENILDLGFHEKFDLIMFRGVIEHFSDPLRVLKKCSQLMKINGYLFITATPAGDSFAFNVYREKWGLYTPPGHLHFFSVEHLTRILKKMGFMLIDHHYQYSETPYADPEKDFKKIMNDIFLSYQNKQSEIKESVPFPGSMITAVWQKIK